MRKAKKQLDENYFNMIEEILENNIMNQNPDSESLLSMMSIAIRGTTDLSKIIIDNRMRNSEKITDEDIYKIYKESYKKLYELFQD